MLHGRPAPGFHFPTRFPPLSWSTSTWHVTREIEKYVTNRSHAHGAYFYYAIVQAICQICGCYLIANGQIICFSFSNAITVRMWRPIDIVGSYRLEPQRKEE
ncbi:hypothetical protein M5D96_013725, partial [Drosophila gunungcola]